jgi:hypothetical protein
MFGSKVRLFVMFWLFIVISLSVLFIKLIFFVIWPPRILIKGFIFRGVFLMIFFFILVNLFFI